MQYLIGIIVALIGAVLFQSSKKKSTEALLENQSTKETLAALDKDEQKNKGLIEAEAQKQADAKSDAESEKAKNVTNQDIIDFFNNRKPN